MSDIFKFEANACYDGQMETFSEKAALLKFYLEAGVDETIGDMPVNRFAVQAPVAVSMPVQANSARASRTVQTVASAVPFANHSDALKAAQDIARNCQTVPELQAAVESFEGCALKKMATHTVFADGDAASRLMIIDRQPSVDEDRNGQPFAGEGGELLTRMLAAIGLGRADTYLTSILPWRPPGGRNPTEEELSLCLPFAERHIALAKPDFVLLCGEAAGILMKKKAGINKLRGKWASLQLEDTAVKALPIFHPSFLLDFPNVKKQAWTDLQALKSAMESLQ